jgi:hypothetical protein
VLLTDDIHWHVPGHDAIAGDYQGIEAVLAYFRRRRDLVDRTFRLHPGDVLVGDGDRIAALTDGAESLPALMRPLLLGCSISWPRLEHVQVTGGRYRTTRLGLRPLPQTLALPINAWCSSPSCQVHVVG